MSEGIHIKNTTSFSNNYTILPFSVIIFLKYGNQAKKSPLTRSIKNRFLGIIHSDLLKYF